MAMPTPLPSNNPDNKTAADLVDILPMTAEVIGGHLHIGGVDMVQLARDAGTALYVMDEAHIRQQLRDYLEWTRYHWALPLSSSAVQSSYFHSAPCSHMVRAKWKRFAQGLPFQRLFVQAR